AEHAAGAGRRGQLELASARVDDAVDPVRRGELAARDHRGELRCVQRRDAAALEAAAELADVVAVLGRRGDASGVRRRGGREPAEAADRVAQRLVADAVDRELREALVV